MTRFRLTTGPLALFGAVFVLALIVLLPLRLVLGQFDLARTGFAAREATGSVWFGAVREAGIGSIALGDLGAALSPWPLFVGRGRIDLAGHSTTTTRAVHGAVSVSRHSIGVDDMTAVLPGGAVFARFPISGLDLDDVSVRFTDGNCDKAEGRVKAALGGDIAGISLAQGLSGTVRCDGGALLLPLASQSGTEQALVRIWQAGRFRAELTVKPVDADAAAQLELSGFQQTARGHVLTVEGKF